MLSAIRGGIKPACGDSFTWIGLVKKFSSLAVEKKVLTYSVLCWLVTSPRPLREREQSCLSRAAKATNAGVGVTQEHLQSASLSEGKLFSDTLPLCSRYRFENLSLASFRLNQKSLTSPRPLSIQLRKDHSRPMCHVILSPITI